MRPGTSITARSAWSMVASLWPVACLAQAPCNPPSLDCRLTYGIVEVDTLSVLGAEGWVASNVALGGEYGQIHSTTTRDVPTERMRRVEFGASESVEGYARAQHDSGIYAQSQVAADIETGRLRAQISGQAPALPPASIFDRSYASASVSLLQFITFKLPAGFAGGTVPFAVTLDATLGPVRASFEDATRLEAFLSVGGNPSSRRRYTEAGPILDVLRSELTLPAAPFAFELPVALEYGMRLEAGGGYGAFSVNAFNTATLAFTVPEGIEWSATSPNFLAAVPEPGTWVLWATGLLVLGVARGTRGRIAGG